MYDNLYAKCAPDVYESKVGTLINSAGTSETEFRVWRRYKVYSTCQSSCAAKTYLVHCSSCSSFLSNSLLQIKPLILRIYYETLLGLFVELLSIR